MINDETTDIFEDAVPTAIDMAQINDKTTDIFKDVIPDMAQIKVEEPVKNTVKEAVAKPVKDTVEELAEETVEEIAEEHKTSKPVPKVLKKAQGGTFDLAMDDFGSEGFLTYCRGQGYDPDAVRTAKFLKKLTQRDNPGYFRLIATYMFGKVASHMRIKVKLGKASPMPVNSFIVGLLPSGEGKSYSVDLLEDFLINNFNTEYKKFQITHDEKAIQKHATQLALNKGIDLETAWTTENALFSSLGNPFTEFSKATMAAIKQNVDRTNYTNLGGVNLEIDEVGLNLGKSVEALTEFLELYQGKSTKSMTKNTKENARVVVEGLLTSANLMMLGTPGNLLDANGTEAIFFDLQKAGLARRSLFNYTEKVADKEKSELTYRERVRQVNSTTQMATINKLSLKLAKLVTKDTVGKIISIPEDMHIMLLMYKDACESRAEAIPSNDTIIKEEMGNRVLKVVKLAGIYAAKEDFNEVKEENLAHAINMVEDSGKSLNNLVNRPAPYTILARYIIEAGKPVSEVDLENALPLFKGARQRKDDLYTLAMSYANDNDCILSRTTLNGIHSYSGIQLEKTDMNKLGLSVSDQLADGFKYHLLSFDNIAKFFQLVQDKKALSKSFCVHDFINEYRSTKNVIQGFNLAVLDIDSTVQLQYAKKLLEDFTYIIYTTKSHQVVCEKNPKGHDCFRVIIPLSHKVQLDAKAYKEFMGNLVDWLPFDVDEQASRDIARKWELNSKENLEIIVNHPKDSKGESVLMNTRLFETGSTQNNRITYISQNFANLDKLQKWFTSRIETGNRNNMLFRYACIIVDGFKQRNQTIDHNFLILSLTSLNESIKDTLSKEEIESIAFSSVARDTE